jgi:hypothetical protein
MPHVQIRNTWPPFLGHVRRPVMTISNCQSFDEEAIYLFDTPWHARDILPIRPSALPLSYWNSEIYVLFYVSLKNFSSVWRRHHCRWRAAKFRLMLGAQGLWAGRGLYRTTPAVTQRLGFSGIIRRTTPFTGLLQHARGMWRIYSNSDPNGSLKKSGNMNITVWMKNEVSGGKEHKFIVIHFLLKSTYERHDTCRKKQNIANSTSEYIAYIVNMASQQ